jgi:mRNA interferase MazF
VRHARPLARGDIILVSFPFTDLSGQKVRPALVLAPSSVQDIIVAFITSQTGMPSQATDQAECRLSPGHPEFRGTGLKDASTVRLDKLATLHRGLVHRRLGRIGAETGATVASALRYVFAL